MLIEPLTKQAFLPFGDLIEANEEAHHFTINKGYTERFHDLANIDTLAHNGKTAVSIFVSTPLPLPLKLELLERHPLSSQAFIPLNNEPYLVAVAPKGNLNPQAIKIFIANGHQGVNYHAGTWHHFCLALNRVSQFLVVDRISQPGTKSPNNCDEKTLEKPIILAESSIRSAISALPSVVNS